MAKPTKKDDLIKAINALGEEPPPSSWNVAELKVRLAELEESKGISRNCAKTQTPFELWMIRLNEAKKNKATLQMFTRETHGGAHHGQRSHERENLLGEQAGWIGWHGIQTETCVRLARFVKWIEIEKHPEHMDTFAMAPPPLHSKVKKGEVEANSSMEPGHTQILQQMNAAIMEVKS